MVPATWMPRSTALAVAAAKPAFARSRSFSATARRMFRVIRPVASSSNASVAETSLPPAPSILPRASSASRIEREKRLRFQTITAPTSPSSTRRMASFQSGRSRLPPEASSSSSTPATSSPSRRAARAICSR
jgi:hypothetical protein